MPVDRVLVIRKLSLISGDLKTLEPLSKMTFRQYSAKPENEYVAERLLERIITRMIDINYHIITETGHPPPRDFYASFVKLGELSVLDPNFARRVAAVAGLRNRLAFEYEPIDPKKLHRALKRFFHDLPIYMRRVLEFAATNKAHSPSVSSGS